ncbi:MAG TPA: hydrogen peroxide-inducible genes activator [Burkholderiales bacterium]|nr:hydrogen peroxide-inducible genes activator [Burkholderiales bacterium]
MSALPSIRQLRYLVAVADRLNFRAAAESCFVTQSTLSAGIKELESVLGTELVERDKRHVRLTPAGEEVVAKARALIAQAQDLVATAQRAAEPLAGPFRLGVIPTIAPFLLPRIAPKLRAAYPRLKLYLREDLTDRLLDRLRSAELDAALIALPYATGELAVRALFRDEFWFVARTDDPLAREKAVAVERLAPREIVLLEEGHCLRDHAIVACGVRAPGETPAVEATSLATLVQMVEGGLGATLLPEMTLKAGILNGTSLVARRFASRVPARTIALVSRPGGAHGRDADLIAAFIAGHAAPKQKAGLPSLRRRA